MIVRTIQDVQALHPLIPGDVGHFVIVVATTEGRMLSCYGTLPSTHDLLERVFKPAAAHLEQKLNE